MGLGTSSSGLSPFGFGTPAQANEPPEADAAGSRYLNPGSRDFEVDADSRQLKQMPDLRQRVMLRLLTLKGSSTAIPRFGVGLPDKMGTGFERRIASAVRLAFEHEINVERIMRLDEVVVEKVSSGRAQVTVVYTDLRTKEQDSVTTNG